MDIRMPVLFLEYIDSYPLAYRLMPYESERDLSRVDRFLFWCRRPGKPALLIASDRCDHAGLRTAVDSHFRWLTGEERFRQSDLVGAGYIYQRKLEWSSSGLSITTPEEFRGSVRLSLDPGKTLEL